MKNILILSSLLFVAGCSVHEPTPPRLDARVSNYEKGMRVNVDRTHIDSKGYIHSMYDPVIHCHTLHYPGKKPERICRLVK
jgi:hypothetical protein